MLNRLFTTLAAAALTVAAMGTTPVRRTLTHARPDGTQQRIDMWANGRYAVYTLEDGTPVLRGTDGEFRPASLKNGHLQFSPTPTATTAADVAATLDTAYPTAQLQRNARLTTLTNDGLGTYGTSAGGQVASIGAPRIPVVMVEYADLTFQDFTTEEKVARFFNEEGYADESGARGSVRDYFTAQSAGMFTPQFDVVARVKVSQSFAHYGADSTDGAIDPNVQELAREAVEAVYAQGKTLSAYAQDGTVPMVAIMYAGPGEQALSTTDAADHLWGAFHIKPFTTNDGTLKVGSFIVFDEVMQHTAQQDGETVTVNEFEGVGLFCHEFGHALGLPDFYYTGSDAAVEKSILTMDWWSIMDSGEYFYNGYAPPGYTAFERSTMGWLDVKELSTPQAAKLYTFGQESRGATAYVIRNAECPTEFYLLENRQPATWYVKGMGRGMLVTHVDYDADAWRENRVNTDPLHQRFAYVPADNVKDGTDTKTSTLKELLAGYKGDLFPGTSNVTSFTDETSPAATLFNGTSLLLSRPLYHIAMTEDSVVTFNFMQEDLSGIQATEVSEEQGAVPTYFTLSGRRLPSLSGVQPGVYILRQGRRAEKVVVR